MPPGNRNAFNPNPVNAMGVPAGFGVEGTGTPSTMDFEVLRGMLGGAWQNLVSPLYLARDTAQSVRDMAPRGFYADLYEAGKRVAANPRAVPGMVQNALKQSAEYARSSPYAMGETIGGMLDVRNMLRRRPSMAELDVYHGTPHTLPAEEGAPLGRFRSEKIGTGEGAQAYGYGLYFAESPNVARTYIPKGQDLSGFTSKETGEFIGKNDPRFPEIADTMDRMVKNGYGERFSEQFLTHGGSLYTVDLPDPMIERMLDWDKPISQNPQMQKAFNKFWKGLSKNERAQAVLDEFGDYDLAEQMAKNPGELRGRLAYSLMTHHFGDQAAASDFLRQQGIPGIRYLDAGSRGTGQGTRNFVVFPGEEGNLTIKKRE